jgi:hypothetical protein
MIKYLENRIWSLNAKIINTEADPNEVNRQLMERIPSGIFSDGGIIFSYSENPIGNYSFRPVEVCLSLSESAVNQYNHLLSENGIAFQLSSYRMIINTFGFLNIAPVYLYTGPLNDADPSVIESTGDASAELIDAHFDAISQVIDALDTIGIIRKSDFYHFGVPSGIEKTGLHTKDDSYNYFVHIFYRDEDKLLQNTIKMYEAEDASMTYEEHVFYSVFPIYFWELRSDITDDEIIRMTAIDSYMICETVAVNNALHVYNSFLNVLNQNNEVDSNHLRKIFNYNTWLIQYLRLFNPNFTLHQFRFMKMYRQTSDIESKYALLKDAEQSLSFAIEGIEVKRSQHSERVMQFILALFTALTLYSVITDVVGLLTSDVESFPFLSKSVNLSIFMIETVVILSFILFFRKISRKM